MAKGKDTYVSYELDFLEKKTAELKLYIENRPFDTLTDRMAYRQMKGGGSMPVVVSTIEQQLASINKALKDYADMVRVIADLREKEEAKKISSRGDQNISDFESGAI
jgi:hypothetical protein